MLPLFQSGRGDSMKPCKERSAFFFKKQTTLRGTPQRCLRSGRYGGTEGARTLDLRVANAALSQLSYDPKCEPAEHSIL